MAVQNTLTRAAPAHPAKEGLLITYFTSAVINHSQISESSRPRHPVNTSALHYQNRNVTNMAIKGGAALLLMMGCYFIAFCYSSIIITGAFAWVSIPDRVLNSSVQHH